MHFCNQGSGIISVSIGQMKKLQLRKRAWFVSWRDGKCRSWDFSPVGVFLFGVGAQSKDPHVFFDTHCSCSDTSSRHPVLALNWVVLHPCCSVVFLGVLPTKEIPSPGQVGIFIQLSVSSIKMAVKLLCRLSGGDGSWPREAWTLLKVAPWLQMRLRCDNVLMLPYPFPTGQHWKLFWKSSGEVESDILEGEVLIISSSPASLPTRILVLGLLSSLLKMKSSVQLSGCVSENEL